MNDWTSYGRIDADGTVYVKTAEGERVVGSWQAGTPEEGLAHFARRFADLVTEVDLIESRLASGVADPSQAAASVRRLRDSLAEAHVVGDLDGLAARLDKLAQVADEKAKVYGGCGPRLNPEKKPEEWIGKGGAKAKLENEKPKGETIKYEELIKRWTSSS